MATIFTITYSVYKSEIRYQGSTTLQFATKADRDARYALDRKNAIKYFNKRHCGYYKGTEAQGMIMLKSLDESLMPYECKIIECGELHRQDVQITSKGVKFIGHINYHPRYLMPLEVK